MAGLANNNNPFQSQVRVGPNYIQLVPGPPGPAGSIGSISGTGLVHVTSGNVDNAAYLGAAGGIPIVNSGGTDTTWLAIGSPGQVLTVVGGAPTWAAAPSGVTWANDLSSSSNTHQYVSSISGANGTGGTVGVGDGVHALFFIGNTSAQVAPPQITWLGSAGFSAAASAGGNGGAVILQGANGGAGQGTNHSGGAGGSAFLYGGNGGASTGTANNANGGIVQIQTGSPGSGGSGTAGVAGDMLFQTGTVGTVAFISGATNAFGIGGTPGTDPTITRGTGVPATTQTNGSLFLRTDGTNGANALYAREGGAWYAVGAGPTWANDLSSSTNLAQWVSGISGSGGTGGSVSVGDGIHSITFFGVGSSVASPPQIQIQGSQGLAGNSGGQVGILAGLGGTSSGVGGAAFVLSGQGGTAAAGNNTGGAGGQTTIAGGNGGVSTGTAANVNGGNVLIYGGLPGSGGSGAAAHYGDVLLSNATTKAFVTENPAGPGFGIGTTPGTDPTLTRGTGVPATTQTNGSLFLRTDGSSGANALYAREGGVWYAIGGTTTTSATLTFEGQAFQLAAAGSGNGTILWPVGQATPTITQTILASDVAPANIAITAQSAQPGAATHLTGGNLVFTSGTGATTNGTPGSFVFNLPALTGSGLEGDMHMTRAGVVSFKVGTPSGNAGNTCAWFDNPAASPTVANCAFLGNNVGATYLNCTAGQYVAISNNIFSYATFFGTSIQFFNGVANNTGGGINAIGIQQGVAPTSAPTSGGVLWMNIGSPGSLGLFTTGVQFHRLAGAITISQDAPTSDVAPASLSVTAQGAFSSAVTHVSGASLTLTGGQGQAGLQGGQITLSGNNNVVPAGLVTLTASAVSLGTTSVTFQKIQSSPLFGHDAQTSDVATSALTIQAQTAFTGASTNINGASITLKGGNSATGAVSAKGGDVLIRGGDTLSSGTATNGAGVTLQTGTGTSPGDIAFNLGGTKVASFSSTPNVVANTQFLWEDGVVNGSAFNFGFRNKTADTVPQPCTLSGQNAWSSASTNKTGGSGSVQGGTGVGGVGPGTVVTNGGGTGASAGQIWLQAPGGVGNTAGITLSWMSASPAISATGTTTLSSSQYNCPFLHFTGTITGAVTVAFPNVAGFWLVDLSAMAGYSATNTISFNCGSTTKLVVNSATALSGTDTLVVVVTNGSNTIYLLGSTATAI